MMFFLELRNKVLFFGGEWAIAHPTKIVYRWAGIHTPIKHAVAMRAGIGLLRDSAFRIVDITKGDGIRWAGLRAVVIAPTALSSYLALARFSSSRISRVRCRQKLHFSITPFERRVMDGLSIKFSGSLVSSSCEVVEPLCTTLRATRPRGLPEPCGPKRYLEYS